MTYQNIFYVGTTTTVIMFESLMHLVYPSSSDDCYLVTSDSSYLDERVRNRIVAKVFNTNSIRHTYDAFLFSPATSAQLANLYKYCSLFLLIEAKHLDFNASPDQERLPFYDLFVEGQPISAIPTELYL